MDLNGAQKKLLSQLKSPFKFWLFTLMQVPAARMGGLKMVKIDSNECTTSIPFKFLNKNPFKSIYFAVQSMAAEFSTAALALLELKRYKESIAFIVVNIEGEFTKRLMILLILPVKTELSIEKRSRKRLKQEKRLR